MRDPFAPNSNSSMFRDAQIGLLLVAVLLGLFVYVAYYRITGQGRPLPEHVRMAPIAEAVWPNGPPENQTYETVQPSSPTRVVPPSVPSPRVEPNPAQRVASANFASANPAIRKSFASQQVPFQPTTSKPVGLKPVAPKPTTSKPVAAEAVRTDRRVRPVDFQTAESTSKAATVSKSTQRHDVVLDRLDLKPGDQIDASEIGRAGRAPGASIFGPAGSAKSKPPRVVVRPPKLSVNEESLPANQNPVVSSLQPEQSVFEQSRKRLPDLNATKFKPLIKPSEVKTDSVIAEKKNSRQAGNSFEIGRPRMVAPKPTLRSESEPVGNSFHSVANSFQPATAEPSSAETKTENTSFAPQQDIAMSAALVPAAVRENHSSVAVAAVDLSSPTEKPTVSHTSPAFRASADSPKTYVSKPGDSFWSIATEQYGDGRLFDALYRWNGRRVKSFDDLPAATELEIPMKIELVRRWPDLCPSDEVSSQGQRFGEQTVADYDATLNERLYTTLEGDTLFGIAAKKLGQASRYVDIMSKNDHRLPADINHSVPLKPGLRLVLPD